MHFVAPIAVAVAATVVSASPTAQPVTLPVKSVSNVKSIKALVERGEARLRYFNGDAATDTPEDFASGPVTNEDVTYVANVTIGEASWDLIVDTGSSNLWCGARKSCEKTSTGKATGNVFHVSYGSGSVKGQEYVDTVSFASLKVQSQSLGAATMAQGFKGVDGIIGFGPVDLTAKTVGNTTTVPTFMDNLYSSKSIPTEVLGVSFRPEQGSATNAANGELTLGGTDSTKYTGSLNYVPTAKSGLVSKYWGVDISSFQYGSKTLGSKKASAGWSGIVDTGTTLIYLPSPVFRAFITATGGKIDEKSGLVSFKTAPTETFTIKIGSVSLPLTPAQYLVPKTQYKFFGLTSGKAYAFFAEGSDSGVQAIVGQKFLENYYAVFDTTNSRIGFATAA